MRISSPPVPEIQAVDVREMAFALSLFQGALSQRLPTKNPSQRGVNIAEHPSARFLYEHMPAKVRDQFVLTGTTVSPIDNPLNRSVFAVLEHYKDDPRQPFFYGRVLAFYFLVNDVGEEGFKKWMKPSDVDDSVMLHPAIVKATASAPVDRNGQFEREQFFAIAERIAKEKYPVRVRNKAGRSCPNRSARQGPAISK